ncbi:MAG: hypothetical protein EXR75_12500 [Myxococcales bacterium]|nr:hypothetical protein [Myxococcales bacterium]
MQADAGEIDLVANKNIYVVAPGVTISAPALVKPNAAINYGAAWTADVPKTAAGKGFKDAMTVIGAVTAAHDLGLKAKKTYKKFNDKTLKFDETLYSDTVKWGIDAVNFVFFTVPKLVAMFTKPEPEPGFFKVNAEKDIGMVAGSSVSLFGVREFSAGSAVWTSISAGLSASMKATGFAGVSSLYTSLKGYRKIEISSDYGKAVLKADKDVEVTAENGKLKLGSALTAQFGSTTAATLIGSPVKTVAVAGKGAGYGMLATNQSVYVGRFENPKDFDTTKPDKDKSLRVTTQSVSAKFADSEFIMSDVKYTLKTAQIDVKSSGVMKLKGSKIMLG